MANIQHEVHSLMDRVECEAPTQRVEGQDTAGPNYYWHQEYEDGDMIDVQFASSPNEITSANPEDLAKILKTFFRRRNNKRHAFIQRRDRQYIAQVIGHEREHGEFMETVGAKDIRYGVEISRTYTHKEIDGKKLYLDQWVCQPYTTTETPYRIQKILHAMTYVYPTEPSEGDMDSITKMGYQGVNDIYNRSLAIKNIPRITPLSLRT